MGKCAFVKCGSAPTLRLSKPNQFYATDRQLLDSYASRHGHSKTNTINPKRGLKAALAKAKTR